MLQIFVPPFLLLVAVTSNLATAIKKRPTQTLSRGWGDDLTWVQTYDEGLNKASQSNKPLMVIHHLEVCPHCDALKKVFAENEEIQAMADKDFIMLNLIETVDSSIVCTQAVESTPDLSGGGMHSDTVQFSTSDDFIPDPSFTVRADIAGRYSNHLYAYEPQDIPLLIENMKKAKRLLPAEL
uniref:anterior gradient protein 3-like isoform X1 n=1 Tax=Pristiophorus japonicus TaxID=55135 RepID=UPI00398E9AC3